MPAPVSRGQSRVLLPETFFQTCSFGHEHIVHRYQTLSTQLHDYLDWSHVRQVFRLQGEVRRQKTGKFTYQVVFGIPQACSPQRLMTLLRHHWHIENRLNCVCDVSLHEYTCTIRHAKRQRILADLYNLVIGLIRRTAFPIFLKRGVSFPFTLSMLFNYLSHDFAKALCGPNPVKSTPLSRCCRPIRIKQMKRRNGMWGFEQTVFPSTRRCCAIH